MHRSSILQKIFYRSIILCLVSVLQHVCSFAQSPCIPISPKCENLINPLGIDASTPRLSWRLQDDRTGASQMAWQLFVSTDSADLLKGKGNTWVTGKISTSVQTVTYKGKSLQPFTKYYWTVKIWDKDARPSLAAKVGSFETGMMDRRNWKGAWISDTRDVHLKPAAHFRKSFLTEKKVRSARAYITAARLLPQVFF